MLCLQSIVKNQDLRVKKQSQDRRVKRQNSTGKSQELRVKSQELNARGHTSRGKGQHCKSQVVFFLHQMVTRAYSRLIFLTDVDPG